VRLPITALLVVGSSLVTWEAAAAASPQTVRPRTAPSQPTAAVPARPTSAPPPELYLHTIVPRDTLIALGRALLTDPGRWRAVQKLNHVRNPRRLRPGSTLGIPIDLLKSVQGSAEVL